MANSKEKFDVSIKTSDGKVVEINCKNVIEGLLLYRPEFIKGKIVLTISSGKKKLEKVIFVPQARRIFNNDSALMIYARNIERAII